MSTNSSFTPIISQELQATVRNNPKIKRVFFDGDNRHYFNAWKLREDKKDTRPESEWDYFGTGMFSHQQEIPGLFNVDKKKESIAKGDPDTRILCIMERKDILTAQAVGSTPQATLLVAEPIAAPQIPCLTPEILDVLAKLASGQFILTPTTVAQPAAEVDDTPPA